MPKKKRGEENQIITIKDSSIDVKKIVRRIKDEIKKKKVAYLKELEKNLPNRTADWGEKRCNYLKKKEISFGPYITLTPGEHTAIFNFSSISLQSRKQNQQPLLRVNIGSFKNQTNIKKLAEITLKSVDLPKRFKTRL